MYRYPSAKKIKAARSYTIPEVAELLGCSTRTVRNWAGMTSPLDKVKLNPLGGRQREFPPLSRHDQAKS